ncbi:MAG: 8-oxoguanine DNA glycosylase [Lachnospiraceae bacterium]|nr:8-oxoguanine DNA glycosylase [Lachnospiraceae bacterium]
MIEISAQYFSPKDIMKSGQCFRWHEENGIVTVPAFGKMLKMVPDGDRVLLTSSEEDFDLIWRDYLDLDFDYEKIEKLVDGYADSHLKEAYSLGKGIRILKQDPWEVIVSFLISQNNNIARISDSIERISEKAGKFCDDGVHFSFPDPFDITPSFFEDRSLGLGYRVPYLTHICEYVQNNPGWIESLKRLEYEDLYEELLKRKGIGPKVANCICLFGFHKTEAFPIDTHVKSLLDKYYPSGFDHERFKGVAGIIQQYLFYYEIR